MAKKPVIKSQSPLRWRKNRIADWRNAAKFTQQQVADALTEAGIKLDRVSVVRIESGKQMATIEVLEFMARMFKTDIDSLLNYTPEQAKRIALFKQMLPKDQDLALRLARTIKDADE